MPNLSDLLFPLGKLAQVSFKNGKEHVSMILPTSATQNYTRKVSLGRKVQDASPSSSTATRTLSVMLVQETQVAQGDMSNSKGINRGKPE